MTENVSAVLHFPKNYINVFLSSYNRIFVTFPYNKHKSLEEILHICCKEYKLRKSGWLFSDAKQCYNLTAKSIKQVFKTLIKRAGISKPSSIHTLRHLFAMHLLKSDVCKKTIQKLIRALEYKNNRNLNIHKPQKNQLDTNYDRHKNRKELKIVRLIVIVRSAIYYVLNNQYLFCL